MCIECIEDLHSLEEEAENLSQITDSLQLTSSPLLIHPITPTNVRADDGFYPSRDQ